MEIARHWRLKEQRYNMIGTTCAKCGEKSFPPRDVCPKCGAGTSAPFAFCGRGEVYSFTTIYEAPTGFDETAPYTVALVRLEEGPLVTAQLTDLGDGKPEIGMPVEMVTRRLRSDGDERGMLVYGYKFRPVLKAVTG
jgi:scaffold protein (connect acetoacetyl-CoA thiolase and HMG-CoA synthase)